MASSRGFAGSGIDTVARADLSGGNVNTDLVKTQEFPGAIAVDAKHIYWVNDEAMTIARADLDGSHVNYNFIPYIGGEFQVLIVHGNYIYWTQYGSTRIGRARTNGTNVNPNFVNIGPAKRFIAFVGLTVEGKHLYWSDPEARGTIGRVDLDGKNVCRRFMVGLGEGVSGLAADGKHLYWVNARWGTIGRSDLNGGHQIKPFIAGAQAAPSIAVDAQHIYWANYGPLWTIPGAWMIGSAGLSGDEVNLNFIHAGVRGETGSSVVAGLAVGQ
ncbi:MAG: hypothetical protein ACTHM1_04910 [Solirubrobacteraceae bacterium]